MSIEYIEPLSKLKDYGSCQDFRVWPNYLKLGITEDHVDRLIDMALDLDLYNSSLEPEMWAPVHAWRCLGQLKAVSSAPDILKLLTRIDEHFDDWIAEEIPEVFMMLGPESISAVETYINSTDDDLWAKISAMHCLEKIGNEYPDSRDKCIEILVSQLEKFNEFNETYNAFLISYLLDLKAVEHINLIKKAFENNTVDLSVAGDFEDIEIIFGLRSERSTPRPNFGLWAMMDYFDDYDLTTQVVRSTPKIMRNDPCPCGSGKKYKKCCLNNS